MSLTFDEMKKKYYRTMECIISNRESALHPETNPTHATWIHHPTLVRWLYGSSQEFLEEFDQLTINYKGSSEEDMQIAQWKRSLHDQVYLMKDQPEKAFQDDRLLMEATV